MRLTLPGGTTAYYEEHSSLTELDEPPVILIHGANVSLRSFDKWIALLRGKMRLIAVDLPGHGLTGPTVEGDYSPAGMTAFLSTFLQALGVHDRAILVGHSLGGYLVWRIAVESRVQCAGLVLISSGGLKRPRGPQRSATIIASLPMGPWFLRRLASKSSYGRRLKHTFFDPALVTPEFISGVWEANREADVQSATMSRLRGPFVEKAFISRIAEIQVPTLVMWGMNDPVFPIEVGLGFKERISGSDFVAYEKCGHFPMMERADATARDFIRFYRETVA